MENIVVVSDLHLGSPASLLDLSEVRGRFIDNIKTLGDITAFVLLGDILDLTMAPRADAWNHASSFFYDLFSDFNRHTQVYYIPGNHDHHIWMLLLEQEGIIRPLTSVLSSGTSSRANLEPLKLYINGFGPDTQTFVHALFPPEIRSRVWIKYPFLRLTSGDKPLLLHHGHYFDWKITPLALQVAERYKSDRPEVTLAKVEECNSAWAEGVFYYSSLGRTSREFLNKTYFYYKKLLELTGGLFRALNVDYPKASGEKCGGLVTRYIADLICCLYEKSVYNLVFGHTHRYDFCPDESNTINMYNIGGWLVEGQDKRNPEVSPVILQIQDGQYLPIMFKVTDNESGKALKKAENISPLR